jgi:hypothetical protein
MRTQRHIALLEQGKKPTILSLLQSSAMRTQRHTASLEQGKKPTILSLLQSSAMRTQRHIASLEQSKKPMILSLLRSDANVTHWHIAWLPSSGVLTREMHGPCSSYRIISTLQETSRRPWLGSDVLQQLTTRRLSSTSATDTETATVSHSTRLRL